jgi:hypothetical protein
MRFQATPRSAPLLLGEGQGTESSPAQADELMAAVGRLVSR